MTSDRTTESPGFSREETAVGNGSRDGSSSAALDGGRFAPGTVVDARYRIVGLLGRGGMGEVYRADDLKLGEPVALKFLPETLTHDGAALARFHREVRTARQITHRSVVRVHDIGEVDGVPFISMEYVDGEDLASLLIRIGRLPQDKALELTRQLCAGLAAAHERGVLHRDLKPANVMIDGAGRAKISDFGLAGLASELGREFVGTPAYMAPEQLAEGKTSFASDVYSLGLVLWEMFAGKPAFQASSREELMALQRSTDSESLSTEVSGLDERIEQVLRRSLHHNPTRRPQSALDLAAALPGGDPLAEALAAGETPSPEMVARVGGQAVLSRPIAAALLLATLALLAAVLTLLPKTNATSIGVPLERQVLAHRAQSLLELAGWEGRYQASGWGHSGDLVSSPSERRTLEAWKELAAQRPTFLTFWYRTSPQPIQPTRRWFLRVTPDDPPVLDLAVASVELDGDGRLRSILVPPASERPVARAEETDWRPFFEAAGLSISDFREIDVDRPPPVFGDSPRSWIGTYPGQPSPTVRVDAVADGSRPSWWRLADGESIAEDRAAEQEAAASRLVLLIAAAVWIVAGRLAYLHFVSGRGDRKVSFRLAAFVAVAFFVIFLLLQRLDAGPPSMGQLFSAVATAAMLAVLSWILYMSIEPIARRYWPRQLTAWTRLLSGDVSNPLVGRDVLFGLAISGALLVLKLALNLLHPAGPSMTWIPPWGARSLSGVGVVLAGVISPLVVLVPMILMLLLVLCRALLRRRLPSVVAAAGLMIAFNFSFQPDGMTLANALWPLALVLVGAWIGLLAVVAMVFFTANLTLSPVSADPSIWWSVNSAPAWVAIALLAIWAYRAAVRGGTETPQNTS